MNWQKSERTETKGLWRQHRWNVNEINYFWFELFTVCDTLNIHGAENIVKKTQNEKSRQMCFELCSSSEWVVRSVAGCIEKLKKLKKH